MALAAEVPEPPVLEQEDGAMKSRPPLSGWLLKRKSDKAVSRVISSTNRRYFTLDFDAQVFYYAHGENTKNVSQPVNFRHILSVEPLFSSGTDGEEVSAAPTPMQRQGSKNSVGSGFSRLGKILSRRPSATEEHGFVLHLSGRDMELVCTSKEEADTWVDAMKEAIASGSSEKRRSTSSDDAKAPSTAPGSSVNSPPSPRSEVAPEDSDDEDDGQLAGTLVVGTTPMKSSEEAAAEEPANVIQVATAEASAAAEATESVEMAVDVDDTSSPPETAQENDAEMKSTGAQPRLPPRLPTRSEDAKSREPSPMASDGEVEEVVLAMDNAGGVAAANNAMAWDAAEDGSAPQKSASVKYADKGEGLTLAQRLSQLDFSDDEDEERSPKQQGEKDDDAAKSAEAEGSQGAVEEVQAFVQEADSEDD